MRAAPLFLLFAMLSITGCGIKRTVTPASLSAELALAICTIPAGPVSAPLSQLIEE